MLPRVAAALALLLLTTACTGDGVATEKEISLERPELGACRLLTPADINETSNDSPVVDCSEKHTAETFAVGTFPKDVGDEIDDPALGAHVFEVCERKFRKFLGGSVIKGTVFNRWDGVDTHLAIESDAPPEKIAHLLRNAKAGCFAEGLITQPVPLVSTLEVNGKPFAIEGVTT